MTFFWNSHGVMGFAWESNWMGVILLLVTYWDGMVMKSEREQTGAGMTSIDQFLNIQICKYSYVILFFLFMFFQMSPFDCNWQPFLWFPFREPKHKLKEQHTPEPRFASVASLLALQRRQTTQQQWSDRYGKKNPTNYKANWETKIPLLIKQSSFESLTF